MSKPLSLWDAVMAKHVPQRDNCSSADNHAGDGPDPSEWRRTSASSGANARNRTELRCDGAHASGDAWQDHARPQRAACYERHSCRAAALQDALPYTEPPYWYYPVHQSLGAALLQAGRVPEAEAQFRSALKQAPANGWYYFGLAQALTARGDAAGSREIESALAKTWIGDRDLLQLPRL